jgi:hypothetical protein
MSGKAVFEGLVFDENDNPLDVVYVGGEAFYVIDDDGFKRHISSEQIDDQVLDVMASQVEDNKDIISEQTAKMIGQDDLFTHAMINNQLENIDNQLEMLKRQGMPEVSRSYLGLLGFKIVTNYHGDVVRVDQPSIPSEDE